MAVRRVVTATVDGRSKVAGDGPPPTSWCEELWVTSGAEPGGRDPGAGPAAGRASLEPPPGGTRWRMVTLPPDAVMREQLAAGTTTGVDRDGYHRTATVDYVYVLDGDVTLELDDEEVALHPGDCVVQRGTNHAWRNRGEGPVRLLTVMVAVP